MGLNQLFVSNKEQAFSIRNQTTMRPLLFYAGLFLIAIVYLLTLAPTIFTLDSAEFAAAAYTLGIVHSPGYVIYLLIAKVMTWLPFGDVAYRVNLLSALFSVLTYITLYPLIKRLTGRPIVALAATLTLLVSYYAWSVSVIAEVYSMQMWLFVLLLSLALRWQKERQPYQLYLLAVVTGLTCANNITTVLWWPGILWFLFKHRQTEAGKESLTMSHLGIAAACGIIGLLPLLYLPIRSAAAPAFINVGHFDSAGNFIPLDLTTFSGLRWYLTGQEFDSYFFAYSFGGFLQESGRFLYQLTAAFLGVGLPLGLWGMAILWQRDRSLLSWLWIMILPHLIFFLNYDVVDKATMFLPIYVVWVIFLAVGMCGFIELWHEDANHQIGLKEPVAWSILALPIILLLFNWSFVDTSHVTTFAEEGAMILSSAEEDALIIARWGEAAVLNYYQVVDGHGRT